MASPSETGHRDVPEFRATLDDHFAEEVSAMRERPSGTGHDTAGVGHLLGASPAAIARAVSAKADDDACPECKGRGSLHVERHAQVCGTFEDEEERAHFCRANCSIGDVPCRVCKGAGRLVGVPRAVYMARGGAAPVPFRGYA